MLIWLRTVVSEAFNLGQGKSVFESSKFERKPSNISKLNELCTSLAALKMRSASFHDLPPSKSLRTGIPHRPTYYTAQLRKESDLRDCDASRI